MSIYFNNLIVPICNLSIFFIHFESQFFVFKTFQIVFYRRGIRGQLYLLIGFQVERATLFKIEFLLSIYQFNSHFSKLFWSLEILHLNIYINRIIKILLRLHGSLPARGTKTNRAHPFEPFNFSEMIGSRPF